MRLNDRWPCPARRVARRVDIREIDMKHFMTAIVALAAATSAAADDGADVRGVWQSTGGTAKVRIAPCPDAPVRLCAVVIADKPEPGERSAVGAVGMSDIVADGPRRWKGQYFNGDQRLPATLRMRAPDRIDMRVCVGLFCSTEQYKRDAG
jgi:uncharacterized protein (DUF2147 family)